MVFDIAKINTGAAGVYVSLPVFRASDGEARRRELQNIERMNAFYERLAGYITEFAASEDFPAGGRYRAEGSCRISEDGMDITVTVKLSMYCRGRRTAGRNLCHTWRDGIIVCGDKDQVHAK